ncbi:hypothetical protein pipiens_018585, partial [Culex pipiens pipiens]
VKFLGISKQPEWCPSHLEKKVD